METKTALEVRSNRSLCFPVLITQLCHLAGVDVSFSDPTDAIRLQPQITKEMYIPGEKVKRAQRHEANDHEEEAHEIEDDQETKHMHAHDSENA